jgi:hypothetical protein
MAFVVGAEMLTAAATRPPGAAADHLSLAPPRAVGLVGCSAAGCHAGDFSRTDAVRSPSAASVWLEYDRHARAFDMLTGEKAGRIVSRLTPAEPEDRPPAGLPDATADARCLACHSDPASVYVAGQTQLDDTPAARSLRRAGVGCEACHGRAERWQAVHTGFLARPPARRAKDYAEVGMTWLNDPAVRARVCAGCHLGAPAEHGLPRRDVTHAMIAAGHPRLAFELVSYTARLPPHWIERDRTRPENNNARGRDFAVQAWLAGQTVVAAAAVRLLPDPADRAEWPEFARFDCYACHHEVGRHGWRRPEADGRPGQAVVNRWDVSLPLLRLADRRPDLRDGLANLRRGLRTFARNNGTIEGALAALNHAPADGVAPTRRVAEALRDLTADETVLASLTWDDAAQIDLALAAWQPLRPTEFGAVHVRLAAALRFRREGNAVWTSPHHYSPALVRDDLRELRQLLDAWLRDDSP